MPNPAPGQVEVLQHCVAEVAQPGCGHPMDTFRADIDLDLTGVTLIDFSECLSWSSKWFLII